jgi:uncharacterized phage protein (TIGR01671 family)
MKREIKFRAWHKELHDMGFWDVSKGGDNIFWYTITEYPEMYNLMQFTGLTDKNGKEIYEGDVVKILYSDWMSKLDSDTRTLDEYLNDIAAKGVIEYKDCEFGVKICSDLLDPIHCGKHGFIEIIGNIYENPELL